MFAPKVTEKMKNTFYVLLAR